MNLFLKVFYRFLQGLAVVSLSLYYRRIVFINQDRLKAKAPILIISNHPNTLIDPLIALMWARERCFLLANYSLFKNPISGWLLSHLYCIPVQRPQDVEGQPLRNDEAFRRSSEHLQKGGSIYIAPEGVSFTERHIRPFRTGAARIAFSAESLTHFSLNLKVILVGITYDRALKPFSDVVVEIGEPLSVDEWVTAYKQHPRTVVQEFTDTLERGVKNLVINCRNKEEDVFLQKIETLFQNNAPLEGAKSRYLRSKNQLLPALQNWQNHDEAAFILFKNKVNYYFNQLKNKGLRDVNPATFTSLSKIAVFLLGLPVLLFGLINNILPTFLSNGLVRWMKIDSAYDTTIRYTAGLVFFPLFWWLQTKLMALYFLPNQWIWLYVISLIPTGLAARFLYFEGVKIRNYFRFLIKNKNHTLTKLRDEICEELAGQV